ncbi:MAG: DUF4126 family protein [Thermoleophilaceae bacterium]
MDIGQGAGLATTSGVRPLVPPIVAGVLAHADAGTNFTETDWSWMESWIWIALLAVFFLSGWVFDRSRTNERPRPEASVGYGVLAGAMGALTFAASLADGGHSAWPGLVAGAAVGFVAYLALARLFMRVTQRLQATGDSGTLLGIGRDASAVAVSAAVVFAGVLGYVAVVVALALLLVGRRRGDEKYEGLRVLR